MLRKVSIFTFSVCLLWSAAIDAKNNVDQALASGMVAHDALYSVRLVETKSHSQVTNITGDLRYRWRAVCEAWESEHKFDLRYEYADREMMHVKSDFVLYEDFDQQYLNFTTRRSLNGRETERFTGAAEVGMGGEDGGRVTFTQPENKSLALPAGTMFPMAHTIDLLRAMRAGEKFHTAILFDGSDEKGPVQINAVIGPVISERDRERDESGVIDQSLLQGKSYRARLAFFPLESAEMTADYEMDIILHENGIISDMRLEYQDFTIEQKLKALKAQDHGCLAVPQRH